MKWIGQHIVDLIARFRSDVFLEDISTGTIASGSHLGLDSNNKIVKAADGGGDLTSIVAGTGLSGTSLTGPDVTLNVDASQTQITAVGALNSGTVTSGFGNFDNGPNTLNTGAATVAGLNVVTAAADGNPLITFKQSTTRRGFIQMADTDNNLRIASEYGKVEISAASTNGSDSDTAYLQIAPTGIFRFGAADNDATLTADGNMIFRIDADADETGQSFAFQNNASTEIANLNESGDLQIDGAFTPGTVIASAYLDADTAHLSVDNVFTGATQTITSDGGGRPAMVIQNTGNNADGGFLQFKLDKGAVGADDDRPGNIQWKSDNDAQQQSTFGTIYTLVSDATDGEEAGDMHLQVASYDGTLRSGLYLDGDTNAVGEVDVTIAAGAASITTIAGTLTMGSTAALTNAGLVAVANQSNITGLGTISSGVWNGTKVASAYLDDDTAHLSGSQTFTGTKTLNSFKGTGATTVTNILDEDDMGSDSATALATQQSIKAYTDTRYSYVYMTWSASGTSSMDGSDPEWVFPNTSKGIYEEDWTKDENIKTTTLGSTLLTTSRHTAVNALVIPHDGVCVGFTGHGRNNNSDATFSAGLFHYDGSTTGATNATGIDYGSTGTGHDCTLRWKADADEVDAGGGSDGSAAANTFSGPCKLVSNTTALAVTAGDALMPAIMGPDGSDEIFVTMTIILKIPVTS